MSNGYPTKNIVDPANNNEVVIKDAPNNIPDQIMLHGLVSPSNAPVTMHFRGGKSFPRPPNMDWRILGTKRRDSPNRSIRMLECWKSWHESRTFWCQNWKSRGCCRRPKSIGWASTWVPQYSKDVRSVSERGVVSRFWVGCQTTWDDQEFGRCLN